MSKRHQASRRKTYGRRQHEIRERVLRRVHPQLDVRVDRLASDETAPFGLFEIDLTGARFQFALGD